METQHEASFAGAAPHLAAMPLMNPPPQIFGGDAMSMPVDLIGSFFGDPHALMEEDTTDGKRRRIARACDMCRKKKIKCDGKLPACTHCINYKTECVFTQVEKKRAPPKGAKYIEGLENRLGRMESLLRLSGLLTDEDDANTDLGTLEKRLADQQSSRRVSAMTASGTTSPQSGIARDESPHGVLASPEQSQDSRKDPMDDSPKSTEEVEHLSDMMCSLVTNNCGETRYIGWSIFSPKGIQWVNEKTGDTSFQDMISQTASEDDSKFNNWKPELFGDLFQRPVYRQLPSKGECLSLLKDYFENFNCMFPLFHQPTFMHLVERQYSRDPYMGSGWWASLNIALAIAHRLRVMSNLVPQEEDMKAWGYLKNALGVFSELTLRNTDLLSVQALLGMALFMQGTPNPQPTFLLVAAAIRVSHSIGLHKRGSGFNLNPIEIEQRKRVFWIAYMLDKDICLRSGRPPVQDDDDMNVELPSAEPDDNVGNIPLADGKGKVNLFRLMCEFAVIESKVYKRLYAVRASKQSDGELLNTIGELDQELEEWKDSIPIDFRPEHEIKASHTPLLLHVVMLHFCYYNCLTTIHRMSVHHGYWTSRLSNYAIQGLNARPLNPRVYSSAALCVTAARASISLVKYIPQGDFACVWLISYFPVSALVTLFGNILQNPQDPRARSDVRLMNLVVNFLSALVSDDESSSTRMWTICSEFERIAKVVLEKAEKQQGGRRKRKSHERPEPMEQPINIPSKPHEQLSVHDPSRTPLTASPAVASAAASSTTDSPMSNNMSSIPGVNVNGQTNAWIPEYQNSAPFNVNEKSDREMPSFNDFEPFGDPLSNTSPTPFGASLGAFDQPFLPQDLWQMPMSLEWDWAEMTAGGLAGVENGVRTDAPGAAPS